MEVLKFVEQANKLDDLDDLFDLYKKASAAYGYDRILFSLMTDHVSLGLNAGHGVMQNYPDDWMKHYVEKGYEDSDPVRSFIFSRNGPFVWSELPTIMEMDNRQKACLYGGEEAGLQNGVGIGLRGHSNEIAGVGAASSDNVELDPSSPHVLNLISTHYYYAFQQINLKKQDKVEVLMVTEREREVLIWMAKGKSVSVIADIMGVSESTVKFHTQNIYKKFNTSDRIATVIKALYNGLISL